MKFKNDSVNLMHEDRDIFQISINKNVIDHCQKIIESCMSRSRGNLARM